MGHGSIKVQRRTGEYKTAFRVSVVYLYGLSVHSIDSENTISRKLATGKAHPIHVSWFGSAGPRHILGQRSHDYQVDTKEDLVKVASGHERS
jgi:hypothetical protein